MLCIHLMFEEFVLFFAKLKLSVCCTLKHYFKILFYGQRITYLTIIYKLVVVGSLLEFCYDGLKFDLVINELIFVIYRNLCFI